MKSIKTENIKEGIGNFIESFRDNNSDVTKYASEKVVNKITNEKKNNYGMSSEKISNRKITSKGVK